MYNIFTRTSSDWTDISQHVLWDSLKISESLQEQNNLANFGVINIRPVGGQEVQIYDGTHLTEALGAVGKTLSVYNSFDDVNKFRAGDRVWIAPCTSKEEYATVSSAASQRIILTANTQNTHSVDTVVGKRKFGGHILRTPDKNIRTLQNVEVDIQCVDYTREFNRKLVNDEYEDFNCLQIIRAMLADPINAGLTNTFTASTDDIQVGATFSTFKAPFKSPSAVMQRLADEVGDFHWFIDYERRVHFGATSMETAPIEITPISNNFLDLSFRVDISQVKNQQIVLGGTEYSDALVEEIHAGDGVKREWVLRNKGKNLDVFIGTNSASVTTTQSVLPDFINPAGSAEYFSNFQAQSVRADDSTSTLITGWYVRFVYNEQVPIEVLSRDDASIAALAALGFGDGIVDGRPIVDSNLDDRATAQARADAELTKYADTIIDIGFVTEQEGIKAGQIVHVTDTHSMRNIDQDFLIQKVDCKVYGGENNVYSVKAASSLFGVTELIHKLLKRDESLFVDENAVIRNIGLWQERIGMTESYIREDVTLWHETAGMTESYTTRRVIPPFTWGVFSTASDGVWNLSEWG